MIYTVTLNPSIDYIVRLDALEIGAVNRMKEDLKLPGGKGINVSRILKRIDVHSTSLGFLGGFTGDFIQNWLAQEGLTTDFTHVQDDTRINVKVKAGEETEMNGPGPRLSHEEQQKLKQAVSQIEKGDTLILSGSKPAGLAEDFYQDLIRIAKEKDADFVIDTTGAELLKALPQQPLLVKPNNHELAELYATTFATKEDIIPYGQRLLNEGAQHAIISMAGDGALLFTKEGVYQSNVLKRPVKNSVGAGDSMIAGFVGDFEKNHDSIQAFKWGVACGSATAFSDDLASRELIDELLNEVVVTKIA